MHRMTMIALVAAPLLAPALGVAQGPPAGGQGGRAPVVSPEVHADRTITLRLRAPKADSVSLTGEILAGKPAPRMTRDSAGIWSVSVGPLDPDIYTYAFNVDGVNTPDPQNPYLKPPASTGLATQVEVPGNGPQYYDVRPVPHGMVHIVEYNSTAVGAPRTAWIYTPPNYSQGNQSYPVLFLLHGIGEVENSWVVTGRANTILDNLIADGRARPMVVVMPLGHVRQSIGMGPLPAGWGLGGGGTAAGSSEVFGSSTLQKDLLDDLLPLVERNFRVSRNPDERGIMGLSMGGAQSLKIGLDRPDTFHWVVGLSSALVGQDPAQPFASVLANPAALNQKLKLLYLTIGSSDGLLPANQKFDQALTSAGVRHTFVTTDGAHWFRVWRRNLYDVAPLLFR